jgi:hypothetical protein
LVLVEGCGGGQHLVLGRSQLSQGSGILVLGSTQLLCLLCLVGQ